MRWTSAVAVSVAASGTATNALIPFRPGYSHYTVYALSLGVLTPIGDAETYR